MNKLKNKIFILLLTILTLFSLTIIFIFNYTIYEREYENIKSQLNKIETTHNDFFPKKEIGFNDKKPIIIDSIVYVVTFDNNMNIIEFTNYSNNGKTIEEIKTIVENHINTNNLKKLEIKNLYFNKYFYSYKNNNLIILENQEISNRLIKTLILSLTLFILIETIIIILVINITKWLIKPVEETFNKQKEFIYDASHELKTPLSVIIASAETLEENRKETKWLKNIQNEAEKMNKLIAKLLELAKSENMNKEDYKLNNLSKITELSSLPFESIIFEKGLKLNLEIEKDIFYMCDEDKIKELIGILLDNAIKHSINNSKITVTLKKNNNNIILEVKNKGEEIPKEEQDKIFERFYRIDKSRNRNENRYGLGLSIAKNIVNNHKGTISVNCEKGYTIFKVIFKNN